MVTSPDMTRRRDREEDLPRRPRVIQGRALADLTATQWTVGQVRSALRQHVEGDFHRSALLCDALRGDDRIKSDLRTRVYAVTGLPFRIEPSPDGDQRRAKAVRDELARAWSRLFPASLIRSLLRWGILEGLGYGPVSWHAEGGRWWPQLDVWHPQHIRWHETQRVYQAQSTDGLLDVIPGDGTWLRYEPEGARGWMDASVRGLAIPFLLRGLSRRDWARFGEKHSLPITGAVVPEGADTEDKDDFFDDLRNLASEGIVMLPRDKDGKGFSVEMIEPKNFTAWQGFEHVLLHCDVSIAVELLGQASNATDGGSFAKAVALGALRQDILEADVSIADCLYADILRPWAHFNFGDADLAPRPIWDATPPEDLKRRAEVQSTAGDAFESWDAAARSQGFEVDFEAYARAFGVPVRRLRPPPAPPAKD